MSFANQQVVGKAKTGVKGEFADGNALHWAVSGVDVGIGHIADVPARLLQQCVNADPGFGFWRHWSPLPCILGEQVSDGIDFIGRAYADTGQ